MEHRFVTQRPQLEEQRAVLTLAQDALLILRLDTQDIAHVSAHRPSDISDPARRGAVVRRAARLGFVLDDVDASAKPGNLATVYGACWTNLLTGNPLGSDGTALRDALQSHVASLETSIEALQTVESDVGSSSYSDFTDTSSEGESDSSDDDGDGGSSCESEDDDP